MTGRDDGWVIEAIELTTRRRRRRALEAVSFQVRPGQVTGLLGLPGSGKTAVLRRMLQLERGGGRTLYDGRPFRSLAYPMRSVGVLLDPLAVHPGRTVAGHLRLALAADPQAAPSGRKERIEAVLDVVGLTDQARTRIFELTEGMTVRLGLAQALLGDPQALLLDEPESGLEPEGRPWLTALLRAYASQGRCVLVTGQSTDAMLGYADRILVMDAGRLVGQRTTRQAARELAGDCVIVRTPQALRLAAIVLAAGAEPTQLDGACLEVRGLDRARIGDLAFRNEVPLHELSVRTPGEDPVVAVFEACRKPPTVVPVQTPPAVCVPEAAPATVRMPFEGVLEQVGEGEVIRPGDPAGTDPGKEVLAGGLSYCPGPFSEESAVLSMSAAQGRAPVEGETSKSCDADIQQAQQEQLISVAAGASQGASAGESTGLASTLNVRVIDAEVVAGGADEATDASTPARSGGALATSSSTLMRSDGLSMVPVTAPAIPPVPGPAAPTAVSASTASTTPESAS